MKRHEFPRDRRRVLVGVLASCLSYALSLPPFGLGWWAWIATMPIGLVALDPRRPLRPATAWAYGLLFGELTTLAVGGYWLFHALHGFFGRAVPTSIALTLAVTLTHAGAFLAGAFACSSMLATTTVRARILGMPTVWVAWEFLRSRLLYGCPWDLLGHALYDYTSISSLASFAGVSGLSWLCVAFSASVATAWIERRDAHARRVALAAAASIILVSFAAAALVTRGERDVAGRAGLAPLQVGLVQPGIGRHELWDPALRGSHLDRLVELSRSPGLVGADLLVWPENAVPFLLDADSDAVARIRGLAGELGAAILLGAPRSQQAGAGRARFYNSVYLFPSDGSAYETYDKVRLLPWVESTPQWALGVSIRTPTMEYAPGAGAVVFEVKQWRIAPLVCFESTYPELARGYARMGADLLVNVSNDSWFDRGAATEQHFAMTVFRSVETGLPLIRVANTGVSAAVDPGGRITARLSLARPEVLRVEVAPPALRRPIQVAVGDWLGWLCLLLAPAILWRAARAGPSTWGIPRRSVEPHPG